MRGGIITLARETFGTAEECIAAKPIEVDLFSWTCTSVDGATWTATVNSMESQMGSAVGVFFLLFLFWSAIPLCIAAWLASEREESIGMAIVLTLFLGWIGLAIVYFGQSNSSRAVEGLVERAASPPTSTRTATPRAPAPEPSSPTPPVDVEDRLRRLEALHRDGTVSDAEYEAQRRRILDSL